LGKASSSYTKRDKERKKGGAWEEERGKGRAIQAGKEETGRGRVNIRSPVPQRGAQKNGTRHEGGGLLSYCRVKHSIVSAGAAPVLRKSANKGAKQGGPQQVGGKPIARCRPKRR